MKMMVEEEQKLLSLFGRRNHWSDPEHRHKMADRHGTDEREIPPEHCCQRNVKAELSPPFCG